MTALRLRRAAARLALIAMALNAAWPLLANAQPVDPASEICTASGGKHAGDGAPATPAKGYHASHCNLCPFGAERGAAIPMVSEDLPDPACAPRQVQLRNDVPQVQFVLHASAPPRAPPAQS